MRNAVHCILGLATILATSSAAQAQVMLDLSKVTCDQWVKYQVANPKFIAMWISGYFHGKRGDTMIDHPKADRRRGRGGKFLLQKPGSTPHALS